MSKSTKISSEEELHAGDLISYPVSKCKVPGCRVRHYVIVVANRGGSKFRIIDVIPTGLDSTDLDAAPSDVHTGTAESIEPHSYEVKQRVVYLGKHINNGTLYRYDYEPTECNEPAEVIENARSKIGPYDFHYIHNNCEHFARWCKTGNRASYQTRFVEPVVSAVQTKKGAVKNFYRQLFGW